MTMRLSAISFAGTARTLVAVGTDREASMFFAIAAAAPRSCFDSGSSFVSFAAGAASFATGLAAGFAGAALFAGAGAAFAGVEVCCAAEAAFWTALAEGALTWPFPLPAGCCVSAVWRAVSAFAWAVCVGLKSAKKSCHAASTEDGSARNWSYISSTSHSLGPNCDAGLLLDTAWARLYPSRSCLC